MMRPGNDTNCEQDALSQFGITMRHTRNLREPNWREKLYRRIHRIYPDSYAQARLVAYHKDEMEARLYAQRELTAFMKREFAGEDQ